MVAGLAAVLMWETFKFMLCRRRPLRKTAESQTEDMNIVPLPLASGVPFKSQILFSLWRAGYTVDIEQYSWTVQEEFHGLVGAHLRRWEDDSDSS